MQLFSNAPRNATRPTTESPRDFAISPNFPSDDDAHVLKTLASLPEPDNTLGSADKEMQARPSNVFVSCEIVRAALGSDVVLEETDVQQGVPQSW